MWTMIALMVALMTVLWWQTSIVLEAKAAPRQSQAPDRGALEVSSASKAVSASTNPYLAALTHAKAHQQEATLADKLPTTDQLDPFARRFEPPELSSPVRFVERSTRLLPDASCRERPELVALDAEQQLRKLYAIDPAERYPHDYFFRTFTQFFKQGDEYMQVAAVWDVRMPPVYRVDFYSSPTPDFSRDVIAVTSPITVPHDPDAQSVLEFIESLTQLYQRQGAQLGQRIVEAQLPSSDGKHEIQVTLADQRVQSWGFQGGLCKSNREGDGLHCRCVLTS